MIVVTDRRILDQQLQNTIYQFDHKQGVVQKIDEDTRQLVQALANGTPIIITTLQKFPFIAETLEKLREETIPASPFPRRTNSLRSLWMRRIARNPAKARWNSRAC